MRAYARAFMGNTVFIFCAYMVEFRSLIDDHAHTLYHFNINTARDHPINRDFGIALATLCNVIATTIALVSWPYCWL